MVEKRFHSAVEILATWFGCGRIPRAPGTWGTLGAIPLVWLFGWRGPLLYMVSSFVFILLAIFVAQMYEAISETHDPREVVIDEVAGFLVTMVWVPFNWTFLLVGFGLFRLLDVVKPFPISYIDREVKGGIGVVGDDLIAGILSNIILQFLWQKGWLA